MTEQAEGMAPLERAPKDSSPRFVINRATGLTHRIAADWTATQPMMGWRAACGWAFGGANALMVVAQPPRPWCSQPGCFKGAPPRVVGTATALPGRGEAYGRGWGVRRRRVPTRRRPAPVCLGRFGNVSPS